MNRNNRPTSPQVDEEARGTLISYPLAVRLADEEIAQPAELPLREPCSYVYVESSGNSIVSGLTLDKAARSLNDGDIPSKLYVPNNVDEGEVDALQDESVVDLDAVLELYKEAIGLNDEISEDGNMLEVYDPEAARNNAPNRLSAMSSRQEGFIAGGDVGHLDALEGIQGGHNRDGLLKSGEPGARDGILKNGRSTPRSNSSGKNFTQSNVGMVRSNSESHRPINAYYERDVVNSGSSRPTSVTQRSSPTNAVGDAPPVESIIVKENCVVPEAAKHSDQRNRRFCRPACYLSIGFFVVGVVCTLAIFLLLSMTGSRVFGYTVQFRTAQDENNNQQAGNGRNATPPNITMTNTAGLLVTPFEKATTPSSSAQQPTTTTTTADTTAAVATIASTTAVTATSASTATTATIGTSSTPISQVSWQMVAGPFTGVQANSSYGTSVAMASNYFVIGEPNSLFVGQVQTYQQQTKLSSVIDSTAQKFGSSVDLVNFSGQASLLVGAKDSQDVNKTGKFGSAAYYTFNNLSVWERLGSVLYPGSNLIDSSGEFGGRVAMATSIRRIAVAAPESSVNSSLLKTGKIYSYEFNATLKDWQPMTSQPLIGSAYSKLGSSLDMSLDGSRILAGAPLANNGDGSVLYYEWKNSTRIWNQTFAFPGGMGVGLGTSVAIISDDGGTIAVGGPSYGNGTNQGVIQVYRQVSSGSFTKLPDIVGNSNEKIGTTLCGAKGRLAYGTNLGTFRAHEFNGTKWVEVASGGSTGSPVVSIAMSEDASTVIVGLANEQSKVFKLQ